jgi:sulfur carrier protein
MSLITVYQNNLVFQLPQNSTLLDLLTQQQMQQQSLAIAVNQQIIPQALWAETILNDGDEIAIFQAIAGG